MQAAVTKVPQTGWLKQEAFIPHDSEEQDQVPTDSSSWFVDERLLAVSSHSAERDGALSFLFF